jgi:D-sedoheptulose 7-phosphate isomerase
MQALIKEELKASADLLQQFLSDEKALASIEKAATTIVESLKNGGKIISCGNGGSMADAVHFAEELSGKFRESRAPIPAVAISDPGYISCVANDYGYEHIFSRFVEGFGQKGDILVGFSTSGNSKNVLLAFEKAQKKGLISIALTGNNGGKLANLADIEIRVPHTGYADRIQEIHIKVVHILIYLIEKSLFNNAG